ncbi:MAG: hypothetical protein KBE91_03330 [Bacteroidia bacterium]|nr:hypothetical protein [Bacteroidia bacterium]
MKTKLTFLSVAIVALLGVGMLMAFKQDNAARKYLAICFTGSGLSNTMLVVDETGVLEEIDMKSIAGIGGVNTKNQKVNTEFIYKKINEISMRGYKMVHSNPGEYIFEKE